uniref:Uncharacterized protein n=1 Tax=Lactuca sativa TaxID=4236 RepID=A0A9R1XLK8_LACSA|nr:hypothetical protein LSAT_V11C300147200 [Lactuca sativa]
MVKNKTTQHNYTTKSYNQKLSISINLMQNPGLSTSTYTTPCLILCKTQINMTSQTPLEVVDRGCCVTRNLEAAILCNRFLPTCVDPSKYLLWDSYHPTDKGYNILINQVVGKYVLLKKYIIEACLVLKNEIFLKA